MLRITLLQLCKECKVVLIFQLSQCIKLKYPVREDLLLSFTPGKTEVMTLNRLLRAKEICDKTRIWSFKIPAKPSFINYFLVNLLFLSLSIHTLICISLYISIYTYINNKKK